MKTIIEPGLFDTNNNGAIFSDCGKYRYALWRVWDRDKPLVMFIGLNPSTANKTTNDPTIRRVQKFALDWGFGGVYMMNLFVYVTAHPEELIKHPEHLKRNDILLTAFADKCQRIIFAWGSFKEARERAKEVTKMLNGYALVINKDGSPKHPLYVKRDVKPIKYLE